MSLPEAVPTVTYDIPVGEYAEWTDFDYNAFYDMATDAGLSHRQIGQLSINFAAEPDATPIQNALERKPDHQYLLGNYIPFLKHINIFVTANNELYARRSFAAMQNPEMAAVPSMEEQLNRVVVHEAGHHIDWHLGNHKWHTAAQMARLLLVGSVKKLADRNPEGRFFNTLATSLENGIASYNHKDSPVEKPAYAFDEANSSKYLVVTYDQAPRLEILDLPAA